MSACLLWTMYALGKVGFYVAFLWFVHNQRVLFMIGWEVASFYDSLLLKYVPLSMLGR